MSMRHLDPVAVAALREKRGILLLSDWRPPALPDHLLSVVGCVDTVEFYVSLLPEGYEGGTAGCSFVLPDLPDLTELSLKSADAMAVHHLWRGWHGQIHKFFEDLTRSMADLMEATVESSAPPEPPAPSKRAPRRRKGKKS